MTFYLPSIRSFRRRAARSLACLLAPLILALAAPLFAATITVNSLADTTANDGVCTLREAIIAANTNTASGAKAGECSAGTAGLNVITFSVAGTLQPSSSMPDIATPIHINGYTAPGAAKNTLQFSGGTNAQLKIEVDGVNAGNAPAFKLVGSVAGGSIIEGLVINNSANPVCCAQLGVYVSGVNGAASTIIRGNFFGTDITGSSARYKGAAHVYVDGTTSNLVIGSDAVGALDDSARNLIAGSFTSGVSVSGNMNNLTVRGNLIGSNATGTASIGNATGVQLQDVTNGAITDNLISGNSGFGVRLIESNTAVSIARNLIGTTALGTGSIPNTNVGLLIQDRSNATPFTIDNIDVVDNIVANNTCGVAGCSSGMVIGIANPLNTIIGVRLTRNLVYANKGMQIDLATPNGTNNYVYGVTANDVGDVDSGPGAPNNLQNFPVLSPAIGNGNNISIPYAFNSEASKTFTLEFFQASACDASGHGGANVYLGNATVTTDGSGNASGTVAFASALTTGIVSATATHAVNGTSELSACASLSSSVANVAPLITSGAPTSGVVNTAYTFQIVATGNAPVSYSLGSGSLPPGILLDAASGLLSGTPTTQGTFSGTIVASNGTLPNASQAFSIVIGPAAAALPVLTLSDASMAEGNSGTSVMNFPISLSAPAPVGGVTITYSTANGTAISGSDYVAVVAGTVTIPAGATTGVLPVTINGDTTVEADETFTVTMIDVTNATISGALAPKTTATGTILNDDAILPPIVVANATSVPVDSPWALLVVMLGVIGFTVGEKRALKAKTTTQINGATHV